MDEKSVSKAAFLRWFKPLLTALKDLGGSGFPNEVRTKIIDNEKVTDEELKVIIGKSGANKFENEVAWARNYLVMAGYIDKSVKGVWILTKSGYEVDMTDELASEIFKKYVKVAKEKDVQSDDVYAVNAWLLTYNPKKWDWNDYDKAIEITKSGAGYYANWNITNQNAKIGDRVFIIRLGDNSLPKGIFATGFVVSEYFEDDNFDVTKDTKIKYVDVLLTKILDYRTDDIISLQSLKERFPEQKWNPQDSGIRIEPEAAQWLIDNFDKEIISQNKKDTDNIEYWFYSPGNNASMWEEFYNEGIMGIGRGKITDLKTFNNLDEIKNDLQKQYNSNSNYYLDSLSIWQFANEMKHGDIVFAKKGIHTIVGCGIVVSDYIYDTKRELFKHIRKVKWTHKGEWQFYFDYLQTLRTKYMKKDLVKALTNITQYTDYVKKLKNLIGLNNDGTIKYNKPYSKNDFLDDVFFTESEYDKLRSLVLRKKNIILQGAPGVGKTFSAKRLAYSIIGEKNENRICMVQFHQNYSYEDFIMGYRPNDSGGFELQSGVFFNFCERCKENLDKPYFFIIDEINRGNLSKIFGELLMLIETDKRGEKHKLNLVYGGTAFYIPENLHIIGMMNTADRSLAMIDYALRRRFSFYTMQPAFENADQNGFGDYMADIQCELYHSVIAKIRELNDTIHKDSTLGKGFEIGHSYFAPENKSDIDDEWVRGVVEYEIIPLIEEYWFDNDKMVDEWTKALYQVMGD